MSLASFLDPVTAEVIHHGDGPTTDGGCQMAGPERGSWPDMSAALRPRALGPSTGSPRLLRTTTGAREKHELAP
jgi:hypothetical protein